MAIVRIPDANRTLREIAEITKYLASIGIDYERWELPTAVDDGASSEEILAVYGEQIAELKQRGGYVMADVIVYHAHQLRISDSFPIRPFPRV